VIGVACSLLAAGGVALALRGYAPPPTSFSWGARAAVFAIDHAAPFGPAAMALFLAGNIVAELGRKAEVSDVGGERDSVRVPPRDPDGIARRGNACAPGFSVPA
jgi:hypothetical protein